jgi:sigma-54 dependent transcriptional regulator, flagellar regulatory protein
MSSSHRGSIMPVAQLEKSSVKAITHILIGNSPHMKALRDLVARVANSDASVMIAGPSGSGKEVVAQAIHAASERNRGKFVALNCGAIPADLMESELFGHERGSFTGAHTRRIGRFEEADGGTLFLDEIGDMRFDMQVKLLRVLEDRMVTRIGSTSPVMTNVRIISATHQNIDTAIAENRFREDLYFRLGVVPIVVPPLSERVEDIPLLITHMQKGKLPGAVARFDPSAITALKQHDWPGNVRELRNLVERAGVLHGGEIIDCACVNKLLGNRREIALRLPVAEAQTFEAPAPLPAMQPDPLTSAPPGKTPINLKDILETMELERIQMALDMADGVISEAARLLTLKRTTLIEKMRKYGVDKLA